MTAQRLYVFGPFTISEQTAVARELAAPADALRAEQPQVTRIPAKGHVGAGVQATPNATPASSGIARRKAETPVNSSNRCS